MSNATSGEQHGGQGVDDDDWDDSFPTPEGQPSARPGQVLDEHVHNIVDGDDDSFSSVSHSASQVVPLPCDAKAEGSKTMVVEEEKKKAEGGDKE